MQQTLYLDNPQRPKLWDFQLDIVEQVRWNIRKGLRLVCLQSATGSGKTTIAAEIVYQTVAKGRRVLFIAHRRELVEQCSARLDEFGIPHGIIMAGIKPKSQPVQIASLLSLTRRELPPADVVILDEAHRSVVGEFLRLIQHYRQTSIILGLTATPQRLDGRGLGDIYEALVLGPTMRSLMEQGFLVPARMFAGVAADTEGLHKIAGDYDKGEMAERFDKPKLVGDVVQMWQQYARDRMTIAFGCTVEHSIHMRDAFRKIGVVAEHVDGESPKEERREILARARRGEIQVLTNCSLFSEGVDVRNIGCVILARKTASTTFYLQAIGRGLRKDDNKTDCIILDHGNNCIEHGLPDCERVWKLEFTKPKGTREDWGFDEQEEWDAPEKIRVCPECFYIHPGRYFGVCGNVKLDGTRCTYVLEPRAPQFAAGQLREMTSAIDPSAYEPGLHHADPGVANLWRVAKQKGYKPGWVYYRKLELYRLRALYMKHYDEEPEHVWDIYELRRIMIDIPEAQEQQQSRAV